MANKGKFCDRSPIICPAGKVFGEDEDTVAKCMKHYSLQDQIDALKHDAGIWDEKEDLPLEQQRTDNTRHCGIYTEIRPSMMPPVLTRYQALINELKETTYDSSWNKPLGKTRDPTGGLPAGMIPEEITFGCPPVKEYGVKEIINPPLPIYQVLYNSQIGHELYRKSHNDYNPSEQVDRGYRKPPFDPKKCYGEQTIYDPRGIWVRCACEWHVKEPVIPVSKIQADMEERNHYQLGKALTPNKNIDCVPKGHRFGKPCPRDLYGMNDLLKDADCPPCLFKRDFLKWMHTLNELRQYIKKRRESSFNMKNFYNMLKYYDEGLTGWIPKEKLYDVAKCKGLNFDPRTIEPLMTLIGVIKEDNYVHYEGFIELLDIQKAVPELIRINDIPPNNQHYITTSEAAACDYLFINNAVLPCAGTPSVRHDLAHPIVKPEACKADLESLGDETTAEACVNPSIYTNYGLDHRDFFKPREPEIIQRIFGNIGYKFTEESFRKLWQIGVDHDKTGLVCIDTFKNLLKKYAPPEEFIHKSEKLIDLKYCEDKEKEIAEAVGKENGCCKCVFQ